MRACVRARVRACAHVCVMYPFFCANAIVNFFTTVAYSSLLRLIVSGAKVGTGANIVSSTSIALVPAFATGTDSLW